ncbi:MAG: ABC transporter permease [SAR324 cluster bacterium]|nr:ABC transporter permease [Deltaproteobacteria bacterium]MDG1178434.1 ABC transporter permease [SAR324 cluster bacterium]MDG1486769.1 ABC transporter permease [SAR324 cluster bacterium]MDG2064575.1 ABC transporter permease [SAR324 cluster bacterium]RZO40632.1 MAG: ABC transporter permease [Pseudomonadota bacterium]
MSHILKVIAQRISLGFLTLFTISLLITFGVELLPGDLAESILGQGATPETVKVFRAELGLDEPAHLRYLNWLGGIVTGDLGVSLASKREISELVGIRLANTIFLGGFAATIAVPLALFLGILAALFRNTLFDRAINTFTLTTISFPEFFVAYILILFFAIKLGWFPGISNISTDLSFGDKLYRTLLPATTLTLVVLAHMMRMTRATIINLLASPYIEMARLKGIRPIKIILRHALPNALAPIVNVIALNLAYLVVGVVIVEVVFVYPGLGQLMVDSVSKRDIPVVQACSMIFASVYILLNLSADIISIVTNPRILHPR